jgi:hypothetical protein
MTALADGTPTGSSEPGMPNRPVNATSSAQDRDLDARLDEQPTAKAGWRDELDSIASKWRSRLPLTAVASGLGVLLYLVLRAVASQFYTPLGLTVEDVGLGRVDMLVRAAFGVIVIVGVYGAAWLALIGGIRLAESKIFKNQ